MQLNEKDTLLALADVLISINPVPFLCFIRLVQFTLHFALLVPCIIQSFKPVL
jgi:hypothetical protein